MFVFENVQGLLSAEGGMLIHTIQKVLEDCGYKINYKLINASDYGVLQDRKRVILIGVKGKLDFEYPEFDRWAGANWKIKNALFSDLKKLKQGEGFDISNYRTKTNTYQ